MSSLTKVWLVKPHLNWKEDDKVTVEFLKMSSILLISKYKGLP